MNSSVHIAQVVVWMEPYDERLDKLSMNNQHYLDNNNGFSSAVSGGSLIITEVNNNHVPLSDWNNAINIPSYKLHVDVS